MKVVRLRRAVVEQDADSSGACFWNPMADIVLVEEQKSSCFEGAWAGGQAYSGFPRLVCSWLLFQVERLLLICAESCPGLAWPNN